MGDWYRMVKLKKREPPQTDEEIYDLAKEYCNKEIDRDVYNGIK